MTKIQPPELWPEGKSITSFQFQPRPVMDDISIVIPTLGRDILEQCLYWILQGSTWPGCLIVVNQGSKDKVEGWLQFVKSIGVKVNHVPSRQRGRSAGINRGLEQVDTPFIAITDDDCFVDRDWLENLTSKLRENPEAVVTGRVEAAGEDMIVVVTSPTPSVHNKPRLKFDSMSGGNMGTSIVVIKKVGLFDEDPCMQTAEDAEWSYRVLRRNISIFYEPDISLWHYGWRDPAKRAEQYRHYALSHGGFYGKYLRKGDVLILARVVLHLFRALRRWIRGSLVGDADTALLGRNYFLFIIPGVFAGIKSTIIAGKLESDFDNKAINGTYN